MIPSLKPGQVLIIDNASFHKSEEIKKLVESAGCSVIFLPPYSPDLNPIEHYWSSIKNNIRKLAAYSKNFYDSIIDVLGQLCIA